MKELPTSAKAVIEALLTMRHEDNKNPGGVLGAAGGEICDGEMGKVTKQSAPGGKMSGEDKGSPSLAVTQMQAMDPHGKMPSGKTPEEPGEFDAMIKQYKDMGLPGDQARLRALYRLSER